MPGEMMIASVIERAQERRYLTLHQAAAAYGVKQDRLKRAATEGRLSARKLGDHTNALYLVEPAEVERFLRETRRGPKPKARKV